MKVDVGAAPGLVRTAREDAGLTQRALAEAVGLRQSNIAAIEAGTRPVSREMLERILIAAGYRPSLSLAAHVDALKALGAELGIANIRVFGSVARGEDRHSSDIDLLVDLQPSSIPFRLGVFAGESEEMLGFGVDVVVDRGERPGLAHIRETAVPL
ncbi:XRE family transcriptional regulator [Microbacterium sp. KUDC0406]|uniref:XRE family transcriptional regulator n=1 Tax=Microbacterium sp. KUDC0406 TaxID=2909588 RepID=UPI001F19456E|nr:XRE family transcriptional regulator [Microbacterium sp. KUDC0406]UJP09229.1 XRE family transcriptional regulator [Microbacterium sp. KUDC0406]